MKLMYMCVCASIYKHACTCNYYVRMYVYALMCSVCVYVLYVCVCLCVRKISLRIMLFNLFC